MDSIPGGFIMQANNRATSKQAEKYLNDLMSLKTLNTPKVDSNVKTLEEKAGFIVQSLSRKKFRRKLTPKARQILKDKVIACLDAKKPIHFTIPFGGYKHFWNESHPEPDWAEIFNLVFLVEYVTPILAVHAPGVIIEYISEDLILPEMNNYPESALDAYAKNFNELVNYFNKRLLSNLQIKFFRIGDRYDKTKIIADTLSVIPQKLIEFKKLSAPQREIELHRSVRSVMWRGRKDLTGLSDLEKENRIIKSRLIELSYYATEAKPEFLGDYLNGNDHICLCFSYGLSPDNISEDVTLASSYGSVVDFWIGRGILVCQNGRFIPRIVSKSQYASFMPYLRKIFIESPCLPHQNYRDIEILKK